MQLTAVLPLSVSVLLLLPARGVAQTSATLDAGVTRVSYADGAGTTGLSVSPAFQLVRPWQSVAVGGSWSRFDGGIWSIQGHAIGSAYLPPIRGLRPEIELLGSGTHHQDGGGSAEADASFRVHLLRPALGGWVGALAGRAYDGSSWGGRFTGEAGMWARVGPGVVTFTLSASRVGAELDYGEAETAYRVERGSLELVAYGGLRQWLRPEAGGTGWAGATAAFWFGDRVALTLAGGGYPANYGQGLPEGSFGAVGIRVATGRVNRSRRVFEPLDLLIPPVITPDSPAFEYRRAGSNQVTFSLRNVLAERVEVMGDFTSWKPVPLSKSPDGAWTVTMPVLPGLHRLNLRTDGGAWLAPPGLTAVTDEFGGPTGVIVVEQ